MHRAAPSPVSIPRLSRRMLMQFAPCALAIALCQLPSRAADDQPERKANPYPARFAGAIEACARADKAQAAEPGGVVFVGSSSIRMWKLDRWFPELKPLNRGFGGSQISDVNHFVKQTVLQYRPRMVVFFCGSNDIAYGKPPEQVAADFAAFRRTLFAALPECRLIFLAVKPSPKRVQFVPQVKRANELIQQDVKDDARVSFVQEAFDTLVNPDCSIREELFLKDRIHLNEEGYRLWADALSLYLKQPAADN